MVVVKEVNCKLTEYVTNGDFDDSCWFMSKLLLTCGRSVTRTVI